MNMVFISKFDWAHWVMGLLTNDANPVARKLKKTRRALTPGGGSMAVKQLLAFKSKHFLVFSLLPEFMI